MKEIGGYFGLEELKRDEYHKDLLRINTGRNALLYTIKAKNIKKLFIPRYLCDSVSRALHRENIEFEYYDVNSDFAPEFNKALQPNEYLYIVNYFGRIDNNAVEQIKGRFKRVVLDNSHAFFQKPLEGVPTIYSCRKFFGVPDGAYLSIDELLLEDLEFDTSKDRMSHILGRYEGIASDYYSDFLKSDASLDDPTIKQMSKLTRNILGAIDYKLAKKTRNENYHRLSELLCESNKLEQIFPDGPFSYPLYMENGLELKRRLAERKIYVPTLWPNNLQDCDTQSVEYDYSANLLPLPCDQRYSIEDMERISKEIKKIRRELL